jgi:cyclopropane-fatty-acyl-phospholipid synthase
MASQADIEVHYDAHNAVFLKVLDPDYLAYSCGHWTQGKGMKDAQRAKFDYIADKVDLGARRRVLEIGCGWGSFARYCHENYPDIELVGLTLSEEQKKFVERQGWVGFKPILDDWRTFEDAQGFDAVVAIESFEHYASMEDRRQGRHTAVYQAFFEKCRNLSKPEAPLYVQSSIARATPSDIQGFKDARYILEKVFAGSALASISSIQMAAHGTYEFEELLLRGGDMGLTIQDWRRSLLRQENEIRREFGPSVFEFFAEYFDASIRRFESGQVDLLQLTMRPAKLL